MKFTCMDAGKEREQDAVSFAYRDIGEGREQDAVSFDFFVKITPAQGF